MELDNILGMKYLIFCLFIISCSPTIIPKIDLGECVLGTDMSIWKLLRKDQEKYLFVQYPELEGSPVHIISDLSTFKEVECPKGT
jgi:hypothetical protein